MKNGLPSVVEELEGVISAMAHLMAALIVELPEPAKSILLDFVGDDEEQDDESSPEDGSDDTEHQDEPPVLSPEFIRGSARFQGLVLALARHFDDHSESYLERRQRLGKGYEAASTVSTQRASSSESM